MFARVAAAPLVVICALAAACGSKSKPTQGSPTGAIRVAISATGNISGALYRLRSAAFSISGPVSTGFLGDEFLASASVQIPLPPGAYAITLAAGWFLEKETAPGSNSFLPVANATLLSPNPRNFVIGSQITTNVVFQFNAAGEIVTAGDGQVDVAINVGENGSEAGLCSDRFDNDSDTLVDCADPDCAADPVCNAAAPIGLGSLVFTEVMANPDPILDTAGEWFELHNPTSQTADLGNCTLSDNTTTVTLPVGLYVYPGEYLVMAVNGDPLQNGGIQADYVFAGLQLANSNANGDFVALTCGGSPIGQVIWSSSIPGQAFQRQPASFSNNSEAIADTLGAGWCPATTIYGTGQLGSPGASNVACP